MSLSKQRYQALKLKVLEYGVAMRNLGLYKGNFDIAHGKLNAEEFQLAVMYAREDAHQKYEEILEDIALLHDRAPASTVVKDDQLHEPEIL